jgi:hypothetical protein
MTDYIKTCKHCGEINESQYSLCNKCGRVLSEVTKPGKGGGGDSRNQLIEVVKNPVVISTVILFFSLFLPWFSSMLIKFNAFQVAKIFKMVSAFTTGGGGIYSLVNLMIYLIPIGCVVAIVIMFLGGDVSLFGTITGSLPVAVFILLMIISTSFLRGIGFGFIIAMISGINLVVFSRRD